MNNESLVTLREAAALVRRKLGAVNRWVVTKRLVPAGRHKTANLFRPSEVRALAAKMARSPHSSIGKRAHETEPTAEELDAIVAEQSKPENLPAWWRMEARRERVESSPPAILMRHLLTRRAGFHIAVS